MPPAAAGSSTPSAPPQSSGERHPQSPLQRQPPAQPTAESSGAAAAAAAAAAAPATAAAGQPRGRLAQRQQGLALKRQLQDTQRALYKLPGHLQLEISPAALALRKPQLTVQLPIAAAGDDALFVGAVKALRAHYNGLDNGSAGVSHFTRAVPRPDGSGTVAVTFAQFTFLVNDKRVLSDMFDPQTGRVSVPQQPDLQLMARYEGLPVRCFELSWHYRNPTRSVAQGHDSLSAYAAAGGRSRHM